MKRLSIVSFGALISAVLTVGFGCEILATVDRTQIPSVDGGGGEQPTTTTTDTTATTTDTTATTSASTGSTGGMGGDASTSSTGGGMGGGTSASTSSTGGGEMGGGTSASTSSTGGGMGGGTSASTSSTGGGMPCAVPGDCAGMDTDCQVRTCAAGMCGTMNSPQGKLTAAQTAGDCQVNQCDGGGAVETVVDNSDVPVDGETCTQDVCTAGAPSNPPQPSGTVCSEGTGVQCDGAGKCAECLVANDCPGQDTECQKRACTAGVCGSNFTALGTPVAAQTAGDCKMLVCDGMGDTTFQNDDTDVPNDNNACTTDVCMAGVPSHANAANGASCGATVTCLNGTCAGCVLATDCPGVNDECKARSCAVGVCGFSFTASGTAVAMQTAGDCKKNQCDGAGNVVIGADDTDVPVDDGNQCTGEVCNAGVPSHPAKATNTACSQNGGAFCSAAATCVACNQAAQCAGTDTDCKMRTCTANACGLAFQPVGTVTSMQTVGDCKVNQCDGAGNIVIANANGDVPADDGNQCTSEVCNAGVPAHPANPVNSACSQNGGTFCSAGATCVACNQAAQCPGMDTDCQMRSCTANACGTSFAASGTPTSMQTAGDCLENQCNGAGGVVSAAKNTDVPADDGNQCTGETCAAGVPAHPFLPQGTACNQGGGTVCNAGACVTQSCNDGIKNGTETDIDCGGSCASKCALTKMCAGNGDCQSAACVSGICVECLTAAACPGSDTECHARTCNANACGVSDVAAGTATSAQTANDCQKNQCDGAGNIVSVADNTDVPLDDGNQCTTEACAAGVPAHPNAAAGAACNQNSGTTCDGAGMCVAAVHVVSTAPADGATGVAVTSTAAITFSAAMTPATLTVQTSSGACSGSVQISTDGFATCIGIGTAALSAGNTVLTLTAAPGLSYGSTYAIKVTAAAQDSNSIPCAAYTSATGFTTSGPPACGAGVVISQVYGGGGNGGSIYKNDFVELHNNGVVAVSLAGWSIQYASATGTTWSAANTTNLTGMIQPGAYFLVQEAVGAGGTTALPTPDVTGVIAMSALAGKVALVSNTTLLVGGCPVGGAIVDFVGYGSTATCFEGAAATPPPSNTTSITRVGAGCTDVNNNATDFTAGAVTPRNSAVAASVCACTLNEGNAVLEADYCVLQSPTTLSVTTGASTGLIYGRLFEAGVTPPVGASSWVAQLGYGPDSVNPENQSGWTWANAAYNAGFVDPNNDEYQASFTAPAAGKYRYTYRFSSDGLSWTYCDVNGAGANAGLTFEVTQLPILTVTP